MALSTATLNFIDYVPDSNLNKVCWNQKFLQSVQKEYSLKHRQAVIYVNAANDKFRIVANFYGMNVLILPPVSHEKRLSLYVQVGQFLRKFNPSPTIDNKIANEIDRCEKRIERQKKVAKVVKSRRKKAA